MYNKRSIGKKAESLAALFLKRKGFEIVERNYHARVGEIDIIAKDKKGIWHFVEVKSRKVSSLYGRPEEAADQVKQEKIEQAVEIYLEEHSLENVAISLDLIVIEFNQSYKVVRIELLRGNFE